MSDKRVPYEELKFYFEKYGKTSGTKLMRNGKTSTQVKLLCLSTAHDEGKAIRPMKD
jgi:hypothetical protein